MSAKGRKGTQVQENEFYPTPPKVVMALLESKLISIPGGEWIEPCAGTGRIISTVNEYRDDVNWIICELDHKLDHYLAPFARSGKHTILPYGDFVHREWLRPRARVLVMNPPFSLTFQFVKAAGQRADWVICLQRQGWFGTQERSAWLAKHCPDVLQLPWRPSFGPDGKTDNCEYCWFVWPPNSIKGERREGRVAMLDVPTMGQRSLFQ